MGRRSNLVSESQYGALRRTGWEEDSRTCTRGVEHINLRRRRQLRSVVVSTSMVVDAKGNPIDVGKPVRLEGSRDQGIVVEITDADGDADDEGRPIVIPPYVRVRFSRARGDEDSFPASWWDPNVGEARCDDLWAV